MTAYDRMLQLDRADFRSVFGGADCLAGDLDDFLCHRHCDEAIELVDRFDFFDLDETPTPRPLLERPTFIDDEIPF